MSNKGQCTGIDSGYVNEQVTKQLEAEKAIKEKLEAREIEVKVKLSEQLKFVPIVGERSRTYIFDKSNLTIQNVVKLCVRPSGNHRLETVEGDKFIIAAGWIAINIDADKWDH